MPLQPKASPAAAAVGTGRTWVPKAKVGARTSPQGESSVSSSSQAPLQNGLAAPVAAPPTDTHILDLIKKVKKGVGGVMYASHRARYQSDDVYRARMLQYGVP